MRSQKHLKPSFARSITEENIRISSKSSSQLPRARLNTIQNEEDITSKVLQSKSSKKLTALSPMKYCTLFMMKMKVKYHCHVNLGQCTA